MAAVYGQPQSNEAKRLLFSIMQGRREIQLSVIHFGRFSFKTAESFATEEPDRNNTDLVEDQKGYTHHHLVHHIRSRSQDCRDDEIYQNCIFPVPFKKGNRDQPNPGQKNHEYRHLKNKAKSNKEPDCKRKILADSRHGCQEFVVVANQKFKGRRENNKITEGRTTEKTDSRNSTERQDDQFFTFKKARRNKSPSLVENDRTGQENTADEGKF